MFANVINYIACHQVFVTTMTDQHAVPIVVSNNVNNGLWITLIHYVATDSHDNQPFQII